MERTGGSGHGRRSDERARIDRASRVLSEGNRSRVRATNESELLQKICRTIVEKHGGTIDVESEVGRGTTFTVRLPLATEGEGADA